MQLKPSAPAAQRQDFDLQRILLRVYRLECRSFASNYDARAQQWRLLLYRGQGCLQIVGVGFAVQFDIDGKIEAVELIQQPVDFLGSAQGALDGRAVRRGLA